MSPLLTKFLSGFQNLILDYNDLWIKSRKQMIILKVNVLTELKDTKMR